MFESKYFKFDGVRLPPFCRGKMEEIANFPLGSSDLWIVMYPKSELILYRKLNLKLASTAVHKMW
uniref:Sulfotransferase n=1 Tax=Oncorhynchus kisutch TaxID=8019 RepID=A0A8C7GSI9_ONCKI